MKFNLSKCSVLHWGGGNIGSSYMLDGNVLREADDEKDLGVIISKDMKFKSNISAQIKKANRTLGMIKRNFKYINEEIFQNLYSTLVRPHLEFAAPVWSPWQQ